MERSGHRPKLCNPLEAKRRTGLTKKTDTLDARGLAILLRVGSGGAHLAQDHRDEKDSQEQERQKDEAQRARERVGVGRGSHLIMLSQI